MRLKPPRQNPRPYRKGGNIQDEEGVADACADGQPPPPACDAEPRQAGFEADTHHTEHENQRIQRIESGKGVAGRQDVQTQHHCCQDEKDADSLILPGPVENQPGKRQGEHEISSRHLGEFPGVPLGRVQQATWRRPAADAVPKQRNILQLKFLRELQGVQQP